MNMQTTTYDAAEVSTFSTLLPHLPTVVKQRKWLFIIPALVGLIIGLSAAYLLPTTFQSTSVLLVEAPLLPEEVAGEISGAEIIDQRMARIRQEILSRSQLIEIINRNSLYQTELRIKTYSQVIDDMRKAITIEPVTANIQRGSRSTIAFSVSYDYSDPVKAQTVLQSLTQQIIEINSTTQSQQATNTVEFLTDQADELQQQISQMEGEMLSLKSANAAALAGNVGGFMSPEAIQSQIISLEQTNQALKSQRKLVTSAAERDPGVQQAEANLAALRATFADTHPDVILAKQRLEEAKALAKSRVDAFPVDQAAQIDSQIALNERQISSLRSSLNLAASQVAAARQAPLVQQEVSQLQQRLDAVNLQYRRVSDQLNAAKAGKRADDEQQSERLRMVESPTLPESPISPNRPLLIGGGLALGLGFGLFLILALELVHRPIRHVDSITYTMGEPPLVVIPTIYAPGERKGGFFSNLWGGKGDDDDDD